MVQHSFSTLEAPQINAEIKETLSKLNLKKNTFKKKYRKQENIHTPQTSDQRQSQAKSRNTGSTSGTRSIHLNTTGLWQRRVIQLSN